MCIALLCYCVSVLVESTVSALLMLVMFNRSVILIVLHLSALVENMVSALMILVILYQQVRDSIAPFSTDGECCVCLVDTGDITDMTVIVLHLSVLVESAVSALLMLVM